MSSKLTIKLEDDDSSQTREITIVVKNAEFLDNVMYGFRSYLMAEYSYIDSIIAVDSQGIKKEYI